MVLSGYKVRLRCDADHQVDLLALTSIRSSFVSASPEMGSVPFSSDRFRLVLPFSGTLRREELLTYISLDQSFFVNCPGSSRDHRDRRRGSRD